MGRSSWCRAATLAVLLSCSAGCSCGGGVPDPGAAGTTAGGAGMSGAGMGAAGMGSGGGGGDDVPDLAPVDATAGEPRHFTPTNGFEVPALGVAWELEGEGSFLAIWLQDLSNGPYAIRSGLARMPWDDELGDGWYCVGEGSTFTTRDRLGRLGKDGEAALRDLTRLPECAAGSDTLTINERGGQFEMSSSLPELIVDVAQPLGARCIEQTCDIYFSTTNEQGEIGFVFMQIVTMAPVGMTPFNPTTMPTVIESAYLALIRNDGTALLACAGGGTMNRLAMGEPIFSLTSVGAPVTCPSGTPGPSSLDFTTDRASPSGQ